MNYRVGILGATGTVGQQFIRLLEHHPWFRISALAASQRSAGKRYVDAVSWRHGSRIPEATAGLTIQELEPNLDCDFVFSALDSSVAGPAEEAFARNGYPVISNSRNHRLEEDVPLLIPEVNPDHSALIPIQKQKRGFKSGFLVTNPNCSTVGLVLSLKPLVVHFGVEKVSVVTMQAISGAGFPGVAAGEIVGNVIPHIEGEEEKLEREPLKILGTFRDRRVQDAQMTISAQCHRVPVMDGHLEAVSVKLRTRAEPDEICEALSSFQAEPQRLGLPSAPQASIHVCENRDRPQPVLDRDRGDGMTVTVGRIRPCPVLDIRMVVVSHNLVRGAAGAAVLNAELLAHQGYLTHR